MTAATQKRHGLSTRDRIIVWQTAHPFGTQKECAKALGLHPMTVNKHVKEIRKCSS